VLPGLVFCGAALVAMAGKSRLGYAASLAVIVIAIAPWLLDPRPQSWITWKESQVNSASRRAWTHEAGEFLHRWWRPGDGVFTSFGDYTAVYREAGIPLHATLTGDNGLPWNAAILRPDIFLWEHWAFVKAGDPLQTAINRARRHGLNYDLVRRIIVKGADVMEIYERRTAPERLPSLEDEDSVSQSTRREK